MASVKKRAQLKSHYFLSIINGINQYQYSSTVKLQIYTSFHDPLVLFSRPPIDRLELDLSIYLAKKDYK